MAKRIDVPVYLFTGFLEAGKTKFIQETLEDKRFCNGDKTLVLLCEEGIEEYEPDQFADSSVYIRIVEEEAELTTANLVEWLKETGAERVLVEYNGMWQIPVLYESLPDEWILYQEITFMDSSSFLSYNTNMRSLVVDKLQGSEMVVFNRMEKGADVMPFHKLARALNRRIDIIYDYTDGSTEFDEIEDPLPFDVNASVIEIKDEDYALFYRDITEEPKKYDGKTVRFKAQVARLK